MTPEQLQELGALKEAVNNLKKSMEDTTDKLEETNKAMDEMRNEMAKGKGIVVGLLLVASAFGGLVSMAASALINRFVH